MFDRRRSPAAFARMAVLFIVFAPLFVGLVGFVVMSLWNGLLPPIFGLKPIHFWQAVGLLILARLLFGGLRPGPGRFPRRRHLLQRWERMSPEERERFRKGFRDRYCGPSGPSGD